MQFELIALLTLLAVSVNGHRLDQGVKNCNCVGRRHPASSMILAYGGGGNYNTPVDTFPGCTSNLKGYTLGGSDVAVFTGDRFCGCITASQSGPPIKCATY